MDFAFTNDQTWTLTLSIAPWAPVYPLASCKYRVQMRAAPQEDPVVYAWTSVPSDGWGNGTITFVPGVNLITFYAPRSDMMQIAAGVYVYDLQLFFGDFVKDLTGGTITILKGPSR